jgi:hypothetical protein
MEREQQFQIVVTGHASTMTEWKRALEAAESELPPLNAEQEQLARKFGWDEIDYRRGLLAGELGNRRLKERAVSLGRGVTEILEGLGPDHELKLVKSDFLRERWIVRINTPRKPFDVAIPLPLADAVIDSHTIQDLEELRVHLLSNLRRDELIGRQ